MPGVLRGAIQDYIFKTLGGDKPPQDVIQCRGIPRVSTSKAARYRITNKVSIRITSKTWRVVLELKRVWQREIVTNEEIMVTLDSLKLGGGSNTSMLCNLVRDGYLVPVKEG